MTNAVTLTGEQRPQIEEFVCESNQGGRTAPRAG